MSKRAPKPVATRVRPRVSARVVSPPPPPAESVALAIEPAEAWFAARGWTPFAFQREVWQAYLSGRSGLLHAPTGMGKTLAVAIGPMLQEVAARAADIARGGDRRTRAGLKLLWLTPLRALAADTAHALKAACEGLGLPWRVELRTGDTPASRKLKQRQGALPEVLVTTPESLSVLLSYPELAGPPPAHGAPEDPSRAGLSRVRCVVVDEWHELLGSKRGVQTELCLARVRSLSPNVVTWGLSATLGNIDEAMSVLVGPARARDATLVRGHGQKRYEFSTLLPPDIERFPWAGHIGLRLLPQVIEHIGRARSTLVFTNTRLQAEVWFQAILQADDALMGAVALHHGSLDKQLRTRVERALAAGELRACVCTSSLDLGVDFAPVDQVIQIGSPKGVARFLQRAGRSGHQPGAVSRVVCVPTNALELVEFAAARQTLTGGDEPQVEARTPLTLSLDVLVQHMLTLAIGGGFDADQLVAEVRSTNAYARLTDEQWAWALDYVQRGGPALAGYARYQRATRDPKTGVFKVEPGALSRAHRMSIGTIIGEQGMVIKLGNGRTLGTVEEGFIARLKPGDVFAFSGRVLELVRIRGMDALVRPARRAKGTIPSWQGSRMPMSSHLAGAVRTLMGRAQAGVFEGPEMQAVEPLLSLQSRWSRLPAPGVLVVEHITLRDGHHAFVYPLAGRLVHEGLAALCAHRLAAQEPRTFTLAAVDHGFHLHTSAPLNLDAQGWRELLSPTNLAQDLVQAMNAAQLARRQFREVARVAGLISQGFPGERVRSRQLQASAEMYFDVLSQFDAANLLLAQSRHEVLDRQLELGRMTRSLAEIAQSQIVTLTLSRLTPLAFPLWVDSLREQVSTERWSDRVQRMVIELTEQAGDAGPGPAKVRA